MFVLHIVSCFSPLLAGIDPRVQEHKNYLDQFCSDFLQRLQGMIGDSIKEFKSAHINNPLYEEVVQHTLFCQKKVEAFHGRKRTLKVAEHYDTQLLGIWAKSSSSPTRLILFVCLFVCEYSVRRIIYPNACIVMLKTKRAVLSLFKLVDVTGSEIEMTNFTNP